MFGFIQNIGWPELLLVVGLALLIFGPGKLPSLGKSLGEGINSFKKAVSKEEQEETKQLVEAEKVEA